MGHVLKRRKLESERRKQWRWEIGREERKKGTYESGGKRWKGGNARERKRAQRSGEWEKGEKEVDKNQVEMKKIRSQRVE